MVLPARVATWTAARQNVFLILSWRLALRRGPQPDRMCSLLAARVATWTAAVVWGSLAERVCGRVGLIVSPESGAYTVACIVSKP